MITAYTIVRSIPALLVYGLVIAAIIEERRGRTRKP